MIWTVYTYTNTVLMVKAINKTASTWRRRHRGNQQVLNVMDTIWGCIYLCAPSNFELVLYYFARLTSPANHTFWHQLNSLLEIFLFSLKVCVSASVPFFIALALLHSAINSPFTPRARSKVAILINLTSVQSHLKLHSLPLKQDSWKQNKRRKD